MMTIRQLGFWVAVMISTGTHQAATQTGPVLGDAQSVPTLTTETEKPCGWLENPTPANYWLTDADGEWIVSVQGVYQSAGFYDLPAANLDFDDQWVSFSPSGSYGYGCACMDGHFEQSSKYAVQIFAAQPLALERCRADPNLPPEPHR